METRLGNGSVMLIDDDAVTNMINRKLIKMTFTYDVQEYVNAELALQELRHWSQSVPEKLPFAIFLDINMPVMDGWEFLEEFKKLPDLARQKARVFVLTSSIDIDDMERAKSYDVVGDFLSKPLTVERLKSLIGKP